MTIELTRSSRGSPTSDVPTILVYEIQLNRSTSVRLNWKCRIGTCANEKEFLKVAHLAPVLTETQAYSMKDTSQALDDLRHERFEGLALLIPENQSG